MADATLPSGGLRRIQSFVKLRWAFEEDQIQLSETY